MLLILCRIGESGRHLGFRFQCPRGVRVRVSYPVYFARLAKLVYALASKPSVERRKSSTLLSSKLSGFGGIDHPLEPIASSTAGTS